VTDARGDVAEDGAHALCCIKGSGGWAYTPRVGKPLGPLVEEAAAGFDADCASWAPRVVAWIELVREWNTRVDLTAARDDRELCDLMLADALVLARHLPRDAAVVDVGSGAGAPGLPLSMLRPDLAVTLVEPLGKRVTLMRSAIGRDAPNRPPGGPLPRVVRARGESLVGQQKFAVAVSRATLPPDRWLRLGSQLAPEGQAWVLLAQLEAPALDGWQITRDESYRWPLTDVERRAVCYCQT